MFLLGSLIGDLLGGGIGPLAGPYGARKTLDRSEGGGYNEYSVYDRETSSLSSVTPYVVPTNDEEYMGDVNMYEADAKDYATNYVTGEVDQTAMHNMAVNKMMDDREQFRASYGVYPEYMIKDPYGNLVLPGTHNSFERFNVESSFAVPNPWAASSRQPFDNAKRFPNQSDVYWAGFIKPPIKELTDIELNDEGWPLLGTPYPAKGGSFADENVSLPTEGGGLSRKKKDDIYRSGLAKAKAVLKHSVPELNLDDVSEKARRKIIYWIAKGTYTSADLAKHVKNLVVKEKPGNDAEVSIGKKKQKKIIKKKKRRKKHSGRQAKSSHNHINNLIY